MKMRKEITCPLEYTHDILKGKWKMVILWQLYYRETASLAELKKDINGISEKMLLEQLGELLAYGLVGKIKQSGYPLSVSYFLTEDKGEKLIPALDIFQSLGKEYIEEQQHIATQKSK